MPRARAIIPLLVLPGLILFVLGTAQVAGGMTAERDEGVIDYQRLIPMSPLAKVLGYLFGLPVREYVMFLATLPFTAWALWRGQVALAHVWLPLYAVVLSSTLLYHFTGLRHRHRRAQSPLGISRLHRSRFLPLHGHPADGEIRPGLLQIPHGHAGLRGEPARASAEVHAARSSRPASGSRRR